MKIVKISGIEILDSRGNPTIKAYVELDNGVTGAASVPSGASKGSHEACELRDNEPRYQGMGVKKAVELINDKIHTALNGKDIENLKELDEIMIALDNTPQKTSLGANAILAVSMAAARALSIYQGKPLWKTLHEYYFSSWTPMFPRLMVNIINGGAHANWNADFQEYMIIPQENKPHVSVQQASEIFHTLKKMLADNKQIISVGDEGGFAPALDSNAQGFDFLKEAIEKAGYSHNDIDLGTDVAASEFYKNGLYELKRDNKTLSGDELVHYYEELISSHNVLSIEDAFHEDDWDHFATLALKYGTSRMIVGDDLYVTNNERIKKGIEIKATNSVLIKLNQIGSLSETATAIHITRDAGWKVIISHRSGETEDSFIADLAYACGADFIKTGSMSRSERLSKYNRLLEIEAREVTHS